MLRKKKRTPAFSFHVASLFLRPAAPPKIDAVGKNVHGGGSFFHGVGGFFHGGPFFLPAHALTLDDWRAAPSK